MTTPSSKPEPGPRAPLSFLDRVQRNLFILLMLVTCAACLFLMAVLPLAYHYDRQRGQIVTSVTPAGRVLSVTLNSGLFTSSLVQTDAGFYGLSSGVSLGKNEALTLELRANADRYLCDAQHLCTRLF
jgi:hypothetical protein